MQPSTDCSRTIAEFLQSLIADQGIADWQVSQAEEAVKLYIVNFKGIIAPDPDVEPAGLLIAQILYGSGLRLMELARLRIMDIDFNMQTLTVRSGKGDKDRTTVLPETVKDRLREHVEKVKALHEKDLAKGYGEVYLPDALSRKYPNAAKEAGWQYVFPSSRMSVDPRSGKVRRHEQCTSKSAGCTVSFMIGKIPDEPERRRLKESLTAKTA